MATDPQTIAKWFGAKYVGEVPAVGGGPFGMAQLAHILHQRLTPSQGQRPGRPTDASWDNRAKVPMSESTKRRLAELARRMSTAERQVSPMQVAAQLLEDAVRGVSANEPEGDSSRDERPADPKTAEAPQAVGPKKKARRLKKKP
jgi:hypothetical protein